MQPDQPPRPSPTAEPAPTAQPTPVPSMVRPFVTEEAQPSLNIDSREYNEDYARSLGLTR